MKRIRDIAVVLMIVDLMLAVCQLENVKLVGEPDVATRFMAIIVGRLVIMFILCGLVVNTHYQHGEKQKSNE